MDRYTATGRLLGLAAIRRFIIAPRWAEPNRQQKKEIRMTRTRRGRARILGYLMVLGVSAVPAAAAFCLRVHADSSAVTPLVRLKACAVFLHLFEQYF